MAHHATHHHCFEETRVSGETEEGRTAKDTAKTGAEHAGAEHPEDDRLRRAEEWVDRIGVRVGEATAFLGHQLLRLSARVREEAEDIWAEAQNLRRGQRP